MTQPVAPRDSNTWLVGTRKGAWAVRRTGNGPKDWTAGEPWFFGCQVHVLVQDPRGAGTILAAVKTGHLGPTVYRSVDAGRTWCYDFSELTPDGAKCHSVQTHPADANRLVVALSGGGVFVSDDAGGTWRPVNLGVAMDFSPPKDDGSEYEFGHDPHDLVIHPAKPDRWYQQNHCGIYRLDWQAGAAAQRWQRIGKNMPKDVGDIGFSMTCHPRNPDVCWVVPMDGGTVWPRTSVGGKPAVYRTRDGGASWQRLDAGLPAPAWYTILRQAMAHDGRDPLGLAFATTSGDVWFSADEGDRWHCVARHLPKIWSVTAGRLA